MATIDIGKLKFTFKGAFATGTTYEQDDVVSFGGSSWIYVNTTSKTGSAAGNPSSSNSTHWLIMAEGSTVLTTAGDVLTHDGSAQVRLAKGNAGEVLTASSSGLQFSPISGYEGYKILGSNIPPVADMDSSSTYASNGKYPWLADYTSGSEYIPYDGMPNGACGPVKRDRTLPTTSAPYFMYINTNYEIVHTGYSHAESGLGGAYSGAGYNNHSRRVVMSINTEFGGMAADEYPVRSWYMHNTGLFLTNKGNIFVNGQNNEGALGINSTVDRHQWVKNPYIGVGATWNSLQSRIRGVAMPNIAGYQGMGGAQRWYMIDENNRLFVMGAGLNGALGSGSTSNVTKPQLISSPGSIVSISAGYRSAHLIDTNGAVWSSGNDDAGNQGGSNKTSFSIITGVSNVVQVLNQTTYYYNGSVTGPVYALQSDGDLYGIGYNGNGQLGDGTTTNRSAWTDIGGSLSFSSIMVTGYGTTSSIHAFGGTPGNPNNTIYNAGYNGYGTLGRGNTTASTSWDQPVTDVFGSNVYNTINSSTDGSISTTELQFPRTAIAKMYPKMTSGYQAPAVYMLDTNGRHWYFGYEARGVLNNHSAATYTSAVPYPSPWSHQNASGTGQYVGLTDTTVEDMFCFGHHYSGYYVSIIRDSAGQLWAMGYDNNYGIFSNNHAYGSAQWVKLTPG